MDFIYNVDLVTSLIGGIINPLAEVPDIINASVTGGINLNKIYSPALVYCLAHGASIARFTLTVIKTIHCLSQDAAGAGLTGSSRTTKEIGVGDTLAFEGIEQCLCYLLLANYFS
jgi:hypothetical protein